MLNKFDVDYLNEALTDSLPVALKKGKEKLPKHPSPARRRAVKKKKKKKTTMEQAVEETTPNTTKITVDSSTLLESLTCEVKQQNARPSRCYSLHP